MILQVGNIQSTGKLWFAWYWKNTFNFLSKKKRNGCSYCWLSKMEMEMEVELQEMQNEMERSCRRSKACQFFLFLKIYCAHVLLHLFPCVLFPRLISLLVLWKTWRLILRHGLGCLRSSKPVEMFSQFHDCRLVNCGKSFCFPTFCCVI